jgi:acetyl-CoA carboxylase biotin carboxyl carrier protein
MTDGAEPLEPLAPEPMSGAVPDVPEEPAALPTDPGDIALLGLVDRLAALLDRSELTELEIQVGGTGLVLRKPAALAPLAAPAAVTAGAGASGATSAGGEAAGAAAAAAPSRPSVKAPLTGIWYGSPSPGTAPYVTVGGEVVAGQVIGLIEAMKLFNEIKSDLSGRVARIHAENGKLVKARQPLIEVDPL